VLLYFKVILDEKHPYSSVFIGTVACINGVKMSDALGVEAMGDAVLDELRPKLSIGEESLVIDSVGQGKPYRS
jgi:hypothetical protein